MHDEEVVIRRQRRQRFAERLDGNRADASGNEVQRGEPITMKRFGETRAPIEQFRQADRPVFLFAVETTFIPLRKIPEIDQRRATARGKPTSERQRQPRRASALFAGNERRQCAAFFRRDARQPIGEDRDGKHAVVVAVRTDGRRRKHWRRRRRRHSGDRGRFGRRLFRRRVLRRRSGRDRRGGLDAFGRLVLDATGARRSCDHGVGQQNMGDDGPERDKEPARVPSKIVGAFLGKVGSRGSLALAMMRASAGAAFSASRATASRYFCR